MSQFIIKDFLEGVGDEDPTLQAVAKFSRRGVQLRLSRSEKPSEIIQLSLEHPVSVIARKLACALGKFLKESGRNKQMTP